MAIDYSAMEEDLNIALAKLIQPFDFEWLIEKWRGRPIVYVTAGHINIGTRNLADASLPTEDVPLVGYACSVADSLNAEREWEMDLSGIEEIIAKATQILGSVGLVRVTQRQPEFEDYGDRFRSFQVGFGLPITKDYTIKKSE